MYKSVYTLSDLKYYFKENKFDNLLIPRVAVIGDPIKHSKSPYIQNVALREAGFNYQYIRIHSPKNLLKEILDFILEKNFVGSNITIPYKQDILSYVSELSEESKSIGAVNTILNKNGKWIGHNTDSIGIKIAIEKSFNVKLSDLKIIIFGASGGAGKAASYQFAKDNCKNLALVNRTFEKALRLEKDLRKISYNPVYAVSNNKYDIYNEIKKSDLIINATSVGMNKLDSRLIPKELIRSDHFVYDMIYSSNTTLLNDAKNIGAKYDNGMKMLLYQGAASFEYWFNKKASINKMEEALYSN